MDEVSSFESLQIDQNVFAPNRLEVFMIKHFKLPLTSSQFIQFV